MLRSNVATKTTLYLENWITKRKRKDNELQVMLELLGVCAMNILLRSI